MNRLKSILVLLFVVFKITASERPNIIIVITDDQERKEFNFFPEGRDANSNSMNLSPNIDRLAREGVILDQCYVTTSVCTPSRFSVLTGQYASRAQNQGFLRDMERYGQANVHWNVDITESTPNIARLLSQSGYFTGGVGKNHVIESSGTLKIANDADPYDPEIKKKLEHNQQRQIEAYKAVGFDYAASIYKGNLPNQYPKAIEDHNMDWIVKGALDFLDLAEEKEQPFFLYFATTLEHGPDRMGTKYKANPLATPIGFLEEPLNVMPSRESISQRIEVAGLEQEAADVLWLDDGIGALINKLEEMGELDNTIIIYFDDHGMERSKGSLYHGGVISPAFIWGGDLIKGERRIDHMVANIDFVPTILDFCGIDQPANYHVDGKSMKPVLLGDENAIRESIFLEIGATRAVVKDNIKYLAFRVPEEKQSYEPRATHICDKPGGRGTEKGAMKKYPHYYDADQLYDLNIDPKEQKNLFGNPEYADTLKILNELLIEYLEDMPGNFGELKR